MTPEQTVQHYGRMADEETARVEAAALLLGMAHRADVRGCNPLQDAYEALLDLGVSHEELEIARNRSGI